MTITINTIYDLKDNWDKLKDKVITYYNGDWLVCTDSSYDNEIALNRHLFYVLRDNGWLNYINCVISHRAVSNYKWSAIVWDNLEDLLIAYQKLIKLVATKTFKTKKALGEFLESYGYGFSDSSVLDYASYWGGTRYMNAMKIRTPDSFCIYVSLGSSYRDNFSNKNALFRALLFQYCRLINIDLVGFSDYVENGFTMMRKFYNELAKKVDSGSWSDKFIEYKIKEEKKGVR